MKRIVLISILPVIGMVYAYSQDSIVSIPDTAFLYALIEEGVDTNEDGLISYEEAKAINSLDVSSGRYYPSGNEIFDMTGIDAFINLEILKCGSNQITSLDVSNCKVLEYLYCSRNKLTSLDVSDNIALTNLDCRTNELTSLDISKNVALINLLCSENPITGLDLSNCAVLKYLRCTENQLTSLDVSNNTALRRLYCDLNQLSSLDVSKSTALDYLNCDQNQLTSLNVSNITALTSLQCNENQLTSLDISNNIALGLLHCEGNQLTSMDVSNNTALRWLYCDLNRLTSLDVSNNIALTTLSCSNNQLTSLNISGCSDLLDIDCSGNHLTSLDVSGCIDLHNLNCDDNQLTSLNVYGCSDLSDLYCSVNHLASLDISTNTALDTLDISDMITLQEVFVWESFPAGITYDDVAPAVVTVDTTGSPNVFFIFPEFENIQGIRFGSTGDPLNGLTIAWKSEGNADSIAWGYTPDLENGEALGTMSTSIIGTQFEYTFPALTAGSTIHYSIFDSKDGVWKEERIYNTASDASNDQFSFTVLGDSRTYPEQWGIISEATLDTDFTLFMGDIISSGSRANDWQDWFDYGEEFISREPIYHCVGNHDDDDSPSGFDNFLGLYTLPGNELYYSFNYGNAVFICLNSEDPGNNVQYNWLLSTLEANKDQTWKIVFFHKPFYTSPSHEEDMWDYFNTWWKAFDDYGVDMIFNGHTHNYQRTKPINRNISTTYPVEKYGSGIGEGRCQVVSGAAGAPIYGEAVPGLWWLDNSAGIMHFCNIDIDGDMLTFKAIDANLEVFDELVLDKSYVGIDDFRSTNSWIYPNPVREILTIQLNVPAEYSFEILSMNGQIILRRNVTCSSQQIDLSSFQNGVYLITIRSKDFVITKKIFKL